ncbi:Ribosomal protein L11 methyltransferase [bacterium HR15]|nr:Ribosomal protein L11 methyltransferase [bacterium HR15]
MRTQPQISLPLEWLAEERVFIAGHEFRLLVVRNMGALLAALPGDAEIPYWAILWESAVALAQWLVEHPEWVRGKRVLELGAGVGLCGLVAQVLGAQVVQSDYQPDALALCAYNARLNNMEPPAQLLMDWRDWQHNEQYEVILGSDLMYDRALHAPLLTVLGRALGPAGVALLADPWRDAGWEFADKLLASGWQLTLDSRVVSAQPQPREVLLIQGVIRSGLPATGGAAPALSAGHAPCRRG